MKCAAWGKPSLHLYGHCRNRRRLKGESTTRIRSRERKERYLGEDGKRDQKLREKFSFMAEGNAGRKLYE